MNFCDLQRFRRNAAVLRPKITRTGLPSPRKTAPVRRLTVNRRPLSTASRLHFHQNSPSLAQPPTPRNGLYSILGHLLAFDRLPRHRQVSRRRLPVLPCLTVATAFSLSPRIPSNTWRRFSGAWLPTPHSISTWPIAAFAVRRPAMIPNLAPASSGTFPCSTVTPGPRFPIVAPAGTPSSAFE